MNYTIKTDNDAEPINPNTTSNSSTTNIWEQNILREALLASYQEQRRNRFWRNLWRGVWLLIFLAIIVSISRKDDVTATADASKPHTALITLSGEIGGDSYQDQVKSLRDSLKNAYNNHNVKGIIIRANSPGGSPVVSNIAFNEIRRLKSAHPNIPLFVVAEDVCASGCYYIASAADKIYADPSSMVGSIGVIGGGFDFTGLMDKLGVKRRLKTAGSNKGMGDPFSPETPEQAKIWQGMLTDIHSEFIKSVKLGRGNRLKEKENPDLFSGRVYTGAEAQKVGLIDGFGNIYSVAQNEIKAPELVDYSTDDKLMNIIGRRFGAEMHGQLQSIANNIWR